MILHDYITLKSLYRYNLEDSRFYQNTAYFEKKLINQVFFERMYVQKKSCCTVLRILLLRDYGMGEIYAVKKSVDLNDRDFAPQVSNYQKKEFLRESYNREKRSLHHYMNIFDDINNYEIRELVQDQIIVLENAVAEIKLNGMKRYLIDI